MSEQNLASPSLAGPPREEQLRVLVEKWRTHVPERFGAGYGSWQEGRRSCADDLASLLAAVPSSAERIIAVLEQIARHAAMKIPDASERRSINDQIDAAMRSGE